MPRRVYLAVAIVILWLMASLSAIALYNMYATILKKRCVKIVSKNESSNVTIKHQCCPSELIAYLHDKAMDHITSTILLCAMLTIALYVLSDEE